MIKMGSLDRLKKLKKYEIFLDSEIEYYKTSEKNDDSIIGSLASRERAEVLEETKEKLYELFPELKKDN